MNNKYDLVENTKCYANKIWKYVLMFTALSFYLYLIMLWNFYTSKVEINVTFSTICYRWQYDFNVSPNQEVDQTERPPRKPSVLDRRILRPRPKDLQRNKIQTHKLSHWHRRRLRTEAKVKQVENNVFLAFSKPLCYKYKMRMAYEWEACSMSDCETSKKMQTNWKCQIQNVAMHNADKKKLGKKFLETI